MAMNKGAKGGRSRLVNKTLASDPPLWGFPATSFPATCLRMSGARQQQKDKK